MLTYNISPGVEAFSTHISDPLTFSVTLPQHQAHKTLVRRIPEEIDDITGVDALITNRLGERIGVKTADCVPVLLHDPVQNAVAAIHSGWRGTVQNIIKATVSRMSAEYGTKGADLIALIGPCIHVDAFEVGDEVYDAFARMEELKDCGVPAVRRGKWHINLPEVCRTELLQCGVKPANIQVRPECTHTLHHQFYSARWLKENFGKQRILNCIMLKP